MEGTKSRKKEIEKKERIICSKEHMNQEKLTQVSTGTGAFTRQRTLDAAERTQYQAVCLRMLSNPG